MKRIAILGPESTGKSTLAGQLAQALDTVWVPEYARTYLAERAHAYTEADLLAIAQGQQRAEAEAIPRARDFLICDTELTVIKIWSEHRYGRVHPYILRAWRQQHYHHYLLTHIDIPWQPDPQREHPHLREYLFQWYYRELTLRGLPFTVIQGSTGQRLQQALRLLTTTPA